jgi:hypothetical protein
MIFKCHVDDAILTNPASKQTYFTVKPVLRGHVLDKEKVDF